MRPTDRPDGTAGSEPQPALPDTADGLDSEPVTISVRAETAGPASGPTTSFGQADDVLLETPAGRPAKRAWRRLRRIAGRAPGADVLVASGARFRSADVAGATLARLTALPAVLVVAWLLPGLPLLIGGGFLPAPIFLIAAPLAVALAVTGLRDVPASWPKPGSAGRTARGWTSWFGLLGSVAVVAGLAAWQLRESSESLIVLRAAGTYLQTGYWIAQHGVLPISQQLTAFGGAHPGLSFASIGFLPRGTSIFPAVTPGTPMLLAAGGWAHGVTGVIAAGPILGALAALSFAGLVARLVGPQWAPAGALILGLSLPQQYVSRSTLSETALQVVLFGGLCLLADSLVLRSAAVGTAGPDGGSAGKSVAGPADAGGWRARWRRLAAPGRLAAWLTPQRMLALLAGLALGFALLVSLDAALYLLAVIPFAALLIGGRRPQASPFLTGFMLGAGYGAAGAFLLDRPFVDSVGTTLALAGAVAVWLVALSVVIGQLGRFGSVRRVVPRLLARIPLRWLPGFGALLTAAVFIGFAVRPYVQTVRGHPSAGARHLVAALQRAQGLPLDPSRLYSEQTLYWVIWYIGLPTVLLGAFGLMVLVRRCLRALLTWRDPEGSWRIWALPLAIICAGSLVVLWRPAIVPDQPWASRRLVAVVLPGLIICALWSASWLAARARRGGARAGTAAVVGLFCSAAMLVPTLSTTFGLGISHGGKSGGLRPSAHGLALQRTGTGQTAAVSTLCAQIPRKASVVIVDRLTADRFSQVIRGMCGVPVASMAGQPAAAVQSVISAISAVGRVPVLLASGAGQLAGFGGSAVRVLDLVTTGDPHRLTQLPTAPTRDRFVIWITAPTGAHIGA